MPDLGDARDYLSTTHHSIAWLKRTDDAGLLDMHPPFQRNPVWREPQQAALIDTILRRYPIPELYMQEFVDASGDERHVVVDGQQRIRACLDFLDGEFHLQEEETPEYPDASFDDLPDDAKQRIWEYKFVVRVLPTMPEAELRQLFARLNRNNVVLNQQELRHATYWGPFIKQMERLAEDAFWTTTRLFTTNDVRRMLDVEFVSELAIAALHGPQNKKTSLERWYQVYETEYSEESMLDRVFRGVLGTLEPSWSSLGRTRWTKKSDFYSLFTVLAEHVDVLPLDSDSREAASERLEEFGTKVDRYLSATSPGRPSKAVKKYGDAVDRAATDLKNRRDRQDVIEDLLADLF